ncbi:cytochrome c3 family protein [Desulfosediminicola sp.]|uniref:cytochrome c3 family protein n=1 Tax=Desulfosediminicola sp. TaxID=2886825 RepID=UPI003AF20FFC
MVKKDMVRIAIFSAALLFLSLFLLAQPFAVFGAGHEQEQHPELSEQEQYVDCADCHSEATPSVYTEWYESVHGVAMIKCYLCHGTFESFVVSPQRDNCATCHADMLEKEPDTPCYECHIPHTFKVQE